MGTRTWDLPLRLFHWGLAASAVAAFLTGDAPTRGRAHVLLGTLAVVLVVFRFGWGFVGEATSRWRRFTRVHTRSAAASALVALSLVVALSLTGAVVLGGEEGRGLLAPVVSPAVGVEVHRLHGWLAWAGVAWLALHLAGVARQSWVDRTDLAAAMVHGERGDPGQVGLRPGVGLALVAAAAALPLLPDRPPPAPETSVAWSRACGDCHLAFPPDLLPARSWDTMLAAEDHFGEVLGLDEATLATLRAWADAHAAEAGETEHGVRVAASVPADARPDRITTLPWWEEIHAAVPLGDEPRVRCAACHPDADRGSFDGRVASPDPRRKT